MDYQVLVLFKIYVPFFEPFDQLKSNLLNGTREGMHDGGLLLQRERHDWNKETKTAPLNKSSCIALGSSVNVPWPVARGCFGRRGAGSRGRAVT